MCGTNSTREQGVLWNEFWLTIGGEQSKGEGILFRNDLDLSAQTDAVVQVDEVLLGLECPTGRKRKRKVGVGKYVLGVDGSGRRGHGVRRRSGQTPPITTLHDLIAHIGNLHNDFVFICSALKTGLDCCQSGQDKASRQCKKCEHRQQFEQGKSGVMNGFATSWGRGCKDQGRYPISASMSLPPSCPSAPKEYRAKGIPFAPGILY